MWGSLLTRRGEWKSMYAAPPPDLCTPGRRGDDWV